MTVFLSIMQEIREFPDLLLSALLFFQLLQAAEIENGADH